MKPASVSMRSITQPKVEYSSRIWLIDAVAVEIVVLDAEIGPALDVALGAVGHADEDDVA